MTDEQLVKQIKAAAVASVDRFRQQVTAYAVERGSAATQREQIDVVEATVITEFLSGVLHAAWLLCHADGDVSPQQLQRVIMIVGKDLKLESAFQKLNDT